MSEAPQTHSAFHGVDIPSYDVITNCMHCGLCLPTCPTYALTGLETSSPRGRIRLIKAVADGELPITKGFVEEMNFCLDCQACETACPAGVKYGSLVEAARSQIFQGGHESSVSRWLKRLLLNWTFSEHTRLKALARLLKLYDKLGFKWFFQTSGLLKIISSSLHDVQALGPNLSAVFSSDVLPEIIRPNGKPRYRVGFLTGCIMDVAFAEVNIDSVQLLLHHDCEVLIPHTQGCCGSLQAHSGDRETARRMARRNIDAFENQHVDFIVMNSAGCGAFMKEYGRVFQADPELADRARRHSAKIKDITEFLWETGFRPSMKPKTSFENKRVTYHDACHLVHAQKVSQPPRALLESIPGIEFVELPESTWCCGSAGIYNIARNDDSMKLLHRKIQNIKQVGPEIIVTGNPGCAVQIQYGLSKEGLRVELLHTATALWRACEA